MYIYILLQALDRRGRGSRETEKGMLTVIADNQLSQYSMSVSIYMARDDLARNNRSWHFTAVDRLHVINLFFSGIFVLALTARTVIPWSLVRPSELQVGGTEVIWSTNAKNQPNYSVVLYQIWLSRWDLAWRNWRSFGKNLTADTISAMYSRAVGLAIMSVQLCCTINSTIGL